ncbi:LysR substrate-binding domain-containing protein [Rhizobium puerariae]|uniref:LysR substrate-binding domain-containing protein n=1 Tax=Rhizobium puerariae TaxID=1585791 RepID=A0ABV6AIP5_9HYPH
MTVGLTASISTMIGAALIQRVEREHAGLTLRFVSGFSGTNLQWLQRGEVDVAVTCDPEPTKSLHLTPLVREEFFLVERAVHGKEPRKRVRFPDLVTEQLILQGTKRGIRTTIEECARSAGVSILPKVESDTYHSIMNLVLQGVGTSILPLSGIGELLENEIVWASKIVDPTPSRIVAVAYSAEREVSSATRLVAGIIRDVSTDLVEGGIWNASILAVDDSAAVQE